MRKTCLVNRNINALRGRTSMRLEPELWDALDEICARECLTLGEVIQQIERLGHPGGRTSAVRVQVLAYFRRAATESGHRSAGHGVRPAVVQPTPPWGEALQSAGVGAAA